MNETLRKEAVKRCHEYAEQMAAHPNWAGQKDAAWTFVKNTVLASDVLMLGETEAKTAFDAGWSVALLVTAVEGLERIASAMEGLPEPEREAIVSLAKKKIHGPADRLMDRIESVTFADQWGFFE